MLLYKTYFLGIFANCGLDYYASEPFRQVAIFSNKNDVISNFKCSIEMCRLRRIAIFSLGKVGGERGWREGQR